MESVKTTGLIPRQERAHPSGRFCLVTHITVALLLMLSNQARVESLTSSLNISQEDPDALF
jgi:hypothetical protein